MTSRVDFNGELRKLNAEMMEMGDLAKDMVRKGVQAFLEGNIALRDEVARLDREVYRQEQLVENHCVEIIALHQPVASDLRMVSTSLKMITDLNRIGRYGRDIAELAEHHERERSFKRQAAIPLMAEMALSMVTDAIDSFMTRNEENVRGLLQRDDEIDSLWDTIFRESFTYMVEDPRNIPAGTHTILAARYLERIADHACNIGDRVVFMVSGTRLDPYEKKRPPRVSGPADLGPVVTSSEGHYSAPLDEK